MITVTVPLSASDLEFVRQQMAGGKFSDPAEYLQALLRAEQALQGEPAEMDPQLEADLLKGLNSGPPMRADDEFWRRLRAEANQRARAGSGR
jgi:Arc/MetJ-type ribon-helix-helix transcriptional regulator